MSSEKRDPQLSSLLTKAKGRQSFVFEGRTIYTWEQTIDEVHVYIDLPPPLQQAASSGGTSSSTAAAKILKELLDIRLKARKAVVGLRGNPPFLDEELFSKADEDASFWMLEEKEQDQVVTSSSASSMQIDPSSQPGSNQSSPSGSLPPPGPGLINDSPKPVPVTRERELHIILGKAHKGETWSSVFKRHGSMDLFTAQEVQKQIMLERFQEEHPGFDFSGAEFSGQAPSARSFMGGVKYT